MKAHFSATSSPLLRLKPSGSVMCGASFKHQQFERVEELIKQGQLDESQLCHL